MLDVQAILPVVLNRPFRLVSPSAVWWLYAFFLSYVHILLLLLLLLFTIRYVQPFIFYSNRKLANAHVEVGVGLMKKHEILHERQMASRHFLAPLSQRISFISF